MDRRPYLLALDLGTTGNRALVFDRKQNIVNSFHREFPQIFPQPGWVEHDPEAIWKSVQAILQKILRAVPPPKIAALGITNQRETVLIWDRRTGRPLHNAIVWQDRRTASRCEALKKKGLEPMIHARTGLFLDPYFSATKLAWLLDHVKGARRLAKEGRLLAGTIDTWIAWKLSNGALHVTDPSNASRTLLFNIRTRAWDPRLCRIFDIPESILPRVVPTSGIAGETHPRITREALPIASIVGDQQAASFGQGCFKPGIVKNTYGTGLFALESTGRRPRFSKNLITTIAWSIGSLKATEYAVEGSVFVGGAAVQWLRDGLGIIRRSSDVEKLAKSVDSTGGVYFVPALAGLGAPYWDTHARGLLVGMTRGTGRGHIARATLEAIAYQTRDIMELMSRDTHQPFRTLRVDGGASANDFLMQFQADTLGISVERPKILETTALGAAGLAGLAVGFWKTREEFNRLRRIDRTFRPRRSPDRQKRYLKWKDAVSRSRRWTAALAAAAFFLCAAAPLRAEVIFLKNGQKREGVIVEKTDWYVTMEVKGVRIPYYHEEIDHIEGAGTAKPAAAPAPAVEGSAPAVDEAPLPVAEKPSPVVDESLSPLVEEAAPPIQGAVLAPCQPADIEGLWRIVAWRTYFTVKDKQRSDPYFIPRQYFLFADGDAKSVSAAPGEDLLQYQEERDGMLYSRIPVKPGPFDPKFFDTIPSAVRYEFPNTGQLVMTRPDNPSFREDWRAALAVEDIRDEALRFDLKTGDLVMTALDRLGNDVYVRQMRRLEKE